MNTASDIDYARYDHIRPILWTGDALQLLDQRKLPFVVEHVVCHDSDEVASAIHALTVRGAPAIGIAAAWMGAGLLPVAVICCAVVFVTEFFL